MKKKSFMLKFALLGICSVTIPLALTSCSDATVYSVDAKVCKLDSLYTSLADSNVSVKDAIYGCNYNDGDYIFIYGTIANTDILSFLYQNTQTPPYNEKEIDGQFFNTFYQPGGLGNGATNHDVKIIMYIDIPPIDDNAIAPANGIETPFATWSSDDALQQANHDVPNKYTEKTLPDKYKFEIGTYRRYDQEALDYRDLVNYIKTIRPNMQGTAEDGGLIAFKKDSDPKSFTVSDSSYDSILSYYQGSSS